MPTRTGCQDFETAKNFNKHFWSYVWPLLPLQNLETKPFDNHWVKIKMVIVWMIIVICFMMIMSIRINCGLETLYGEIYPLK